MILQVLFWRILGCWVLAAVVAVLEVLPAYARGAMPAPSLLSAARTCVRYGVVLTVGIVFVGMFESIDRIWDFRVKPFSYDLTAYSGYVRQAVLFGFWICFMLVTSSVFRLLNRFVPNDRANAPAAENGTGGVASGN
jgi:hypothetical protein